MTFNHLRFILFIAIISLTFNASSQFTDQQIEEFVKTATPKELVERNSTLLIDGFYYQSIIVSDKLISQEPDNANYNYRKGLALLNLSTNYISAKPYLQKAITTTSKNYDFFSANEAGAPLDSYFYLAKCYHLNEEIDQAIENYNQFIEVDSKSANLVAFAELSIMQCEVAKESLKYPKKYEIVNLGADINQSTPEYAPVVSLDGQSLYFTSRRLRADSSNIDIKEPETNLYLEDVYVSYKSFEDKKFEKPELLSFCLPERNEATVAISTDERRIYVYKDDKGNGDVFYSEFENGKFKELRPVDIKGVNSAHWEPHITVSADGRIKYFSSDRPGGFGGRDIYKVVKLPDGSWGEPQNLGPEINTKHDEDSPFVAIDNKTLYFSSNGEKSMGGFDVFLSFGSENGDWSAPLNLGYPLNSMGDDIYYTTTADGRTGYLSSFRLDGFGDKDIYEIKNDFLGQEQISLLAGEIVVSGVQPIPEDIALTIACLNCGEQNVRTVNPRTRDGKFFTSLPKCREFELVYSYGPEDNKIEFHRETITTNCDDEYEEINKVVLLDLDKMKVIPMLNYNLKLVIADLTTNTGIESVEVLFVDSEGKTIESLTTNSSGELISKLISEGNYGDNFKFIVKTSKEGYLKQEFEANITLADIEQIEVVYLLDKPDAGKDITETLQLNPIYFDFDKSAIRADAKIELAKIIKVMNDNPTLKLDLRSYTDCKGSENYNQLLSNRRAKSSANYIKSRISNPGRLSYKGYGESMPVNNCKCDDGAEDSCTEKEYQDNRRTEFIVIK